MDPYPELPPPPFGGEPEVEDTTPEQPGRSTAVAVAVILGFLVVLGGLIVAGYSWLNAPGRCDASTVESARFGYCVEAPGWELTNAAAEVELPYDELIRPADASTVRIVAVQLASGQGLDDVVQAARDQSNEDGVEVGDVVERRVAGVPAAQWDLVLDSGQADLQVRVIVFVRGDAAWWVQLSADAEAFDTTAQEFEDILRTWTFR
jgi:hypothetical protein